MMVEVGKEFGFTSNSDMPMSVQNGEQPIRLSNGLLYPRVDVEQRTSSGEEIGLETEQTLRHRETSILLSV